MKQRLAYTLVVLTTLIPCLNAQGNSSPPPRAPVANPSRVDTAPVLDGKVIGDPAYAVAQPLTEFWQTTPDDDQPATQPTEVRIVYTSDTLYIGIICYDRNPEGIVVSENRRDALLNETDCVQILLDRLR